jgi:hypothetical protein
MVNMFEKASRIKLRYDYRGLITVEDLWDLPLQALDSLYKKYNAEQRASSEDSLLKTTTPEDAETALRIEILKHVVGVRQAEALAKIEAKAKREKAQQINELIAEKEQQGLRDKSVDELRKMLEELI